MSLLDIDEEISRAVDPAERPTARRALAGEVVSLPEGVTSLIDDLAADPGVWGFYVVSGVVVRTACVGRTTLPELVGPGEVLGPPARLAGPVPAEERFCAAEATALMVLDTLAAQACGRWPALLALLARRTGQQRLRATALGAIRHLPSAETRILVTFWHLAENWGRVTVDGTVIPFPFTHETLGQIVAAGRPTVTLALSRLDREGLVRRLPDGAWLLAPEPQARLRQLLGDDGDTPDVIVRARVARRVARDVQPAA